MIARRDGWWGSSSHALTYPPGWELLVVLTPPCATHAWGGQGLTKSWDSWRRPCNEQTMPLEAIHGMEPPLASTNNAVP